MRPSELQYVAQVRAKGQFNNGPGSPVSWSVLSSTAANTAARYARVFVPVRASVR
jgi:hypothetical protein